MALLPVAKVSLCSIFSWNLRFLSGQSFLFFLSCSEGSATLAQTDFVSLALDLQGRKNPWQLFLGSVPLKRCY